MKRSRFSKDFLHMKHYITVLIALLLFSLSASAQKWSVGTNLVEWADFGTANIECSVAAGRHATVGVGARYNPWQFEKGDGRLMQNKQVSAYVYSRWWPWFIYSGWWFQGKAQYRQYNFGGVFEKETEEGDAYGAGLSFGYTLMIKKYFNLEFGAGFWGGYKTYTVYSCPRCGRIIETGQKAFIMPDNISVSMLFIF